MLTAAIPANTTFIVSRGPHGKGFGWDSLLRLDSDASGSVTRRVVFPSSGIDAEGKQVSAFNQRVIGMTVNGDGSLLWAALCISTAFCDPMGSDPNAAVETRIFRSRDLGASWEEVHHGTGRWYLLGALGDVAVVHAQGQGLLVLPSLEPIGEPAAHGRDAVYEQSGAPVWLGQAPPRVLTSEGDVALAAKLPAAHALAGYLQLAGGRGSIVASLSPAVPGPGVKETAQDPYVYLARLNADGSVDDAFVFASGNHPTGRRPIAREIRSEVFAGTFACAGDRGGALPGYFDARTRQLTMFEHAAMACGANFELIWAGAR